MAIVHVGVDLAKNVFAVHAVDEHGKPALVRPSVARAKLHELVASLPPCTIAMEACAGGLYWARLFAAQGHTVRLIAPKFVTPYRMSGARGKNDAADAAAICEAVQRPSMRFVPVKSVEQQARLMVAPRQARLCRGPHRVHQPPAVCSVNRQYREMGTARNLDEFTGAMRRHVALPWVNTIAADSAGNAFYGDIGSMPNASNAKLAACIKPGLSAALAASRLYALDGSTSVCDLGTDADAPEPGIFGGGNMPGLMRRDFVQNSNDSYWLANPAQRLEGYSQIIGVDENRPQNFRTRLGITQIRDRQAGTDGLPGAGFDQQWLQDVLYRNRHYSAEIMLDGVLQLCATQNPTVAIGSQSVNVAQACSVLAAWDRRNNLASVGAHVWTELWRRVSAAAPTADSGLPVLTAAVLYAVPFDPADPVGTPRGLSVGQASVVTRVMGELAYTVKFFSDNGIPLDRPWGRVQFETRNGERIPIHGGVGISGVYNAMSPAALVPNVGFPSIIAGSSYIQSVTFSHRGPRARAVVTYSQSTDPANPSYADMTKLFSNYGWVSMPFAEGDIRRDPNLTILKLREKR